MNEQQFINTQLRKLSKSKFRSRFHLSKKDIEYIHHKGLETIEQHAFDFIETRLKDADNPNDGKQTPMKGHPVFVAQHATATCCRGCLEKWHTIKKDGNLSEKQIAYIVHIIMAYIELELERIMV